MTHSTYLSFDIGIRNLAYCIVKINTCESQCITILQWEKIDILKENGIQAKQSKKVPFSKFVPLIHQTFFKRLYHWRECSIDVVLVEQQLGNSRNAKLEGMIAMWLYTHLKLPLVNISSHWKFYLDYNINTWTLLPSKHSFANHQARKQFITSLVSRWIQTQPQDVQQFFKKHGSSIGMTKKQAKILGLKQDDLADSVAQAIAWHLKK